MVNEVYTLAGTAIIAASTIYTAKLGERARVAEERRLIEERKAEREALKEHDEEQEYKDDRQQSYENLLKDNARLQAIVDRHDKGCASLNMTFAEMCIFIETHPFRRK